MEAMLPHPFVKFTNVEKKQKKKCTSQQSHLSWLKWRYGFIDVK